tara:strand:- start:1197 stop:1685 length:489 start_codon:yes stop_codon:yes gene_type:complete
MMIDKIERFSREKESTPSFIGRITYSDDLILPVRAYVSDADLEKAFTNSDPLVQARDHLIKMMENYKPLISKGDFVISSIWGEENKKMVGLFLYMEAQDNWPSNCDIIPFIFDGREYAPWKNYTCEDTTMILGEEGKHRRTTPGLEFYMENAPHIPGLKIIG